MHQEKSEKCDFCGRTRAAIVSSGWFGCARCYDRFAALWPGLVGAASANGPGFTRPQGYRLEQALARAVAVEDYEEAARLRDQLGCQDETTSRGQGRSSDRFRSGFLDGSGGGSEH